MRFRKRPVEIEAKQFLPMDLDNGQELALWCGGKYVWEPREDVNMISITTLEGVMYAMPGDWIIRGVKGEFYPCKPAIFEMTYEAIE